jgi:menaquinol-cytochrome c reductase iron-sulfur subunit
MEPTSQPKPGERRDFFKQTAALIISAVTAIFPALAGLTVVFDPLRRKSQSSGFIRVASLFALPNDGVPRKFQVIADRSDAWNKFPQVPIGAVYLRRTGEDKVEAFNVACPHAGCFVDYDAERGSYLCPCHNSTFTIDGRIKDTGSPSARGLDSLEVELRQGTDVWVKFQNFQAGGARKIPVA